MVLGCARLLTTNLVPKKLDGHVDWFTGNLIVLPQDAFSVAQTAHNSLVESFAMRSRCLYEFFYRRTDTRNPPLYIRACDYFDDDQEWPDIRDHVPDLDCPPLEELWERASALAAHVGPERVRMIEQDDKSWNRFLGPVPRAVEKLWLAFVDAAPNGRVHPSVATPRVSSRSGILGEGPVGPKTQTDAP